MINKILRNRYSRQMMFSGIGEGGQEKLSRSCAVIIGCGALGCNIASFLVRAGVGRLKIVDRDFIELHNLQRQVLFTEKDIKAQLPKAIAAERHLRVINSSVQIQGIVADANSSNIEKLVSGADVIMDGLDNLETRYLINDVALKNKIPWVYGGAVGAQGMTMNIIPGETACLKCITPVLPAREATLTCETVGVVGTVPGLIGAIQATEAIKILIGSESVSRGLIIIDSWTNHFHSVKVEPREGCPACQGQYESLQKPFGIKTTSLCGQSRAIQVLDSGLNSVNLSHLAENLKGKYDCTYNGFMLRFSVAEQEIIVFPDGRAVVKNTIDESLAKQLFAEFVSSSFSDC